jgi:menaquinone-dependent protoporphyrinogen oxidase
MLTEDNRRELPMTDPRILIVYASSHGQTEKIARHIGRVMEREGVEVDIVDARERPVTVRPHAYGAIVAGSSLIARGNQPAIRAFIEANRDILAAQPGAFFQVSASAGSVDAAGRAAGVRVMQAFLGEVRWQPTLTASIAGAVKYTQYNPLLRWYMKRASRKHGGATDTSRDHEYTDWHQVEQFAQDVLSAMRGVEVRSTLNA